MYQDALDEYNRLKDVKKVNSCFFLLLCCVRVVSVEPVISSSPKSPDYRVKKRRCKYLKAKLNHIKKRVSDYDRA